MRTRPPHPRAAESTAVGFDAGTTGGVGASAVTVSTLSAFKSAVTGSTAKVVKVSGLISLSGQVDVGSNTTVPGVGSSSAFTGGGLRLKNATNVVSRNLDISKAVGTDALTVQRSTKVWIDHNAFSSDRDRGKDHCDGLVDITHASNYVTVSWNTFKNPPARVSAPGTSPGSPSLPTGTAMSPATPTSGATTWAVPAPRSRRSTPSPARRTATPPSPPRPWSPR